MTADDKPPEDSTEALDDRFRLSRDAKRQLAEDQVERELSDRAQARASEALIRFLLRFERTEAPSVHDQSVNVASIDSWRSTYEMDVAGSWAAAAAIPFSGFALAAGALLSRDEHLLTPLARLAVGMGFILSRDVVNGAALVDPAADTLAIICIHGDRSVPLDTVRRTSEGRYISSNRSIGHRTFASAVISRRVRDDVDLEAIIERVRLDERDPLPASVREALDAFLTKLLYRNVGTAAASLLPLAGSMFGGIIGIRFARAFGQTAQEYYTTKVALT